MIRYDRSPHSVVVVCSCGWREVAVTREGAQRVARMHETGMHPDRFQVRDAERQRRHRAAAPAECHGDGDSIDPCR